MAWIESHTVLVRHRKIVTFAAMLNIKPVHAIGHLHALWHTALEQAEDGDLSSWDDAFIAAAASWEGDPTLFCKALRAYGWVDGHIIHDWLDYAGRYLESKYRTSNPLYLRQIHKKHKTVYRRSKVTPPNLPNQPTKPNLTNIMSQNEILLSLFNSITREKVLIYLDRVRNKNKSKVLSEGRKNTLLNELSNTRNRCNNDDLFGQGIEAAIQKDACCIGYVNAVIKNKQTQRPG